MPFTRQDAVTFLLGLAAAVVIAIAFELVALDGLRKVPNWLILLNNIAVAMLSAVGRYLVTYLAQLGFNSWRSGRTRTRPGTGT